MPTSDQEPENYSIDDMMDRLRSRGEGGRDGQAELVVREDGTQVYRMRKRKRRTRQPKKEKERRQQRFRVAQVVVGVGLVAVSGLALLGSILYLNSAAHQSSVVERIRTWTGAEPQLTRFQMSPVRVSAGSVDLTWPESSMLRSLKLNEVRADLRISSIFGGAWKGSEMVAANGGTLVLQQAVGSAAPASPGREGEVPFQFRYRSPNFTVLMGAGDAPAARLQSTEVSIAVLDAAATTANLQFEGGTLNVMDWGSFGLNFASFQIEPAGTRLTTMRLAPATDAKGEIEIFNPQQVPLSFDSGEAEMAVRVDRVPFSSLVGEAFGKWLSATVETREGGENGTLLFKAGKSPSISYRIPFHATATSESAASQLPLFGILAEEVGEPWYRSPTFDLGFSGTAVRNRASGGIEDLSLEARGRLMITGQVMADAAGVLDGTLEVGLPVSALSGASVPFRAVFLRKEGGHAWATVRVSGSGLKPSDDLQEQITQATATASPASGGKEGMEDEFRDLSTPEKER